MSQPEPIPGPSRPRKRNRNPDSFLMSPMKKRPNRIDLTANEKTIALNVYKHLAKSSAIYPRKTEIIKQTAAIMGLSVKTITRILNEYKTEGKVSSAIRTTTKPTIIGNLDDFTLSAIRRKIHQFYFENELPTVDKVLSRVNNDDDLPSFSRSTIYKIMKKLNFKYMKRSRKSVLLDRPDLMVWRRNYLLKIKEYRRENRKIYYTDETWLNEGHTANYVWCDETIENSRQAFLNGLSTGSKNPQKGKRLIILHIGSSDGFLDGGDLIFEAKKSDGDYHGEMDAHNYEKWLKHTEMFIDENETPESWWVSAVLKTIRAVALVFDIITFPVHLIVQRPWRKRALSRRIKARIIQTTQNSITVRSVSSPSDLHLRLVRDGVTSMESMLRAATARWAERPCLGTRTVLGEEDEPQPNGRVFKKFNMGDYVWRTYVDVDKEARQFGAGLRELGCRPRENVVMFAETRAEWMVAAHGCFKQSIPVVTIYATLGDDAIAHGINETDVSTVITTYELLPKFKKILAKTPRVNTIIFMEDQLKTADKKGYKEGIRIIGYKEVVQKGAASKIEPVPPSPNDTAIIMYTSGSTGVPKGVILSHRNMLATLKAFADAVPIRDGDILMGFLPLAHVFELLAETLCIIGGVPIGYSTPLTMLDSSSKIMKGTSGDATILKPTCITTVPLIMDRISKGITDKVSRSGEFAGAFFKWAYTYKQTWMRRGYDTPLLNKIMFSKVRALLGGRVRLMISGGAPLSPDTHAQVRICLCCDVIAGYGLTETTSCATVMCPHDRSTGRVGAPTTGTDVQLVDWEEAGYRVHNKPFPQGEIVIGGDCVAEGYYKNPEKTKEEFVDVEGRRWFRSGDIGELHHDGCIKIIDRKKDLVKLQAGEYVSLGKVEAELKTCPIVENICVYGDSSKTYTVALVVANQRNLAELAARLGLPEMDFEQLCQNSTVEKAVLKELADHARKCGLEKFEVPAAVKLVPEVWSPDMGLVTAAFKIKRKDIQERYKEDIKRMYAS